MDVWRVPNLGARLSVDTRGFDYPIGMKYLAIRNMLAVLDILENWVNFADRPIPAGRIILAGWIRLVGRVILKGWISLVRRGGRRFGLSWRVGLYSRFGWVVLGAQCAYCVWLYYGVGIP